MGISLNSTGKLLPGFVFYSIPVAPVREKGGVAIRVPAVKFSPHDPVLAAAANVGGTCMGILHYSERFNPSRCVYVGVDGFHMFSDTRWQDQLGSVDGGITYT